MPLIEICTIDAKLALDLARVAWRTADGGGIAVNTFRCPRCNRPLVAVTDHRTPHFKHRRRNPKCPLAEGAEGVIVYQDS